MSTPGIRPVTPAERVSDVLARDESLVEVFVKHGPQFAKLRNRTMRRMMARLVKVEDVARMAGISAAALTRELNVALGIESAPAQAGEAPMSQPASTGSPQPQHPPHARIVEVDVREDLRKGHEPFSRIMATLSALGADEVLRLRATFEPIPLYALLEKRGLVHEARADSMDDWSVWFWRPGDADVAQEASPAAPPPALPAAMADEELDPAAVVLDVRGLEPPEPMLRTLAALETLAEGHTLVQVNARVPQFLLPILSERGFDFEIDESQADRVLVRIWRRTQGKADLTHDFLEDQLMSDSATELDVRAIPPRDKHPAIFRTFDALTSGQAMVLVNDHDPRPLRYQLSAERPDSFDWAYEAEGPEIWRVRISRR